MLNLIIDVPSVLVTIMKLVYSIYLDFLRKVLLPLPGVVEKFCFDWPAFYVKNKLFTLIKEDGETLALYHENREPLIAADPETFFVTEHYRNYKYVLINMNNIQPSFLEELLVEAWRKRAPKRIIKEYDQSSDV